MGRACKIFVTIIIVLIIGTENSYCIEYKELHRETKTIKSIATKEMKTYQMPTKLGSFLGSLWDGIVSTGEFIWGGIVSIGEIIWEGIVSIGENIKALWDGTVYIVKNIKPIIDVIITLSSISISDFVADLVLDGCDAVQMLINLLLNDEYNLSSSQGDILFSYSDLLVTSESGSMTNIADLNKYTKVGNFYSEQYTSYEGQKYVYIDGNEKGFTQNTKIPVIPIDIYNITCGNIAIFDYNFLIKKEVESSWDVLRNMVASIIHVILYVASAMLLVFLIWHGICIVKGSIDNPQLQARHKKGLRKFIISLCMLTGYIIIIALGIYMGDMFLQDIMSEEDELPIRVNVSFDSGGYSFSTNFTGYVRYMAQVVDLPTERLLFAVEYLLLVIINVLCIVFSFLQMFIMLTLAIIGPIIAASYSITESNNQIFNYKKWATCYILLSTLRVFLAIACRIVLECF